MLVSSEVQSRATNKRLRARDASGCQGQQKSWGRLREAVSQVQGNHVIVYLARVEQVCWKNGIQLLFVVLEEYPLQLFLQVCGRVQAGIGRIWKFGRVRQITTGSNGQLLSTGRRGDDVSKV